MKKKIFLTNLVAISTVLGMQNNFAENGRNLSKDRMCPINTKNSSLVENYETFTGRDWISKILQMRLNEDDFNAPRNSDGQTILMCATKYSDCRIMQQVLNVSDAKGNRRVDINAQDINGDTALSIAAKAGDKEKILLLLKNGADVGLVKEKISKQAYKKVESFYQQVLKATTDFVFAINMRNIPRAKSLLKNTPIDVNMSVKNPISGTSNVALISAVQLESIEMLELLLKQPNIDVNIKNANGYTALVISAAKGFQKTV